MLKMYKGADVCNVDRHQIPAMEKAGWSQNAPEEKSAKPVPKKKVTVTKDVPPSQE